MIIRTGGTGLHVIDTGAINVSPQSRDATHADHRRICSWRQFHLISEDAAVQIVSFPGDELHDASLRRWLQGVRDKLQARSLAILYLYRGHQLDTRSPILQHLLNQLGFTHSTFALRIEDEDARRDALSMASALLHTHDNVLLLHDDLNRIAERGPVNTDLKYTLFASGSDRRDLLGPLLPSRVSDFAQSQDYPAWGTCL